MWLFGTKNETKRYVFCLKDTFEDTFGDTLEDTLGDTFGDNFGDNFGDTFGVAKQLRDNDPELHENQTMYSCGSLAPKMKRKGEL